MSDHSDITAREQRIRERAYLLWEKDGKPAGDTNRYWHEAEAQIEAEIVAAENRRKPPG